MNYIEIFKKSVKKNENKTALVHNERKISYKELDILSSKIAHKLHKMGAKKGDFIAINLPRGIEYAASYLGVLKAGLAVIPLSDKYPKERVDFILNESKAFLEIKSEFFADIDSFECYENLGGDDAPALLIYTSGSTSTPKGVLHSVKDIGSAVFRCAPMFKSFENSAFGSIIEFSFIAFCMDFLCGFCLNNEIHIIPNEIRTSPKLLNEYYKKNKITTGTLPLALLNLFSQKPALKAICTGSERVSGIYFEGIEIYNFYGMSESMGFVSSFKIDKKYANTPAGKGSKNTQILVLDENDKECKNGQIGQIVIKGDFNTKYFNDEQKTKETFVKKGSKTLIFTSDLGYKDENGDVVVTGRKDWMVKIHGQRVEIYEIEANLKNIKNVKECAIKAFGENEKYLVAFVVADNLNAEFLQNELAKKLPIYMIPKYFVFMDALPKNFHGKLDRKMLKEPSKDEITSKKDFIEPKTKDEIELCEVFASVLKCGKVGLNDDFTLLGGDSINASKIASISKLKGINPSLILKEKTPASIIKACNKLKSLDNDKVSAELNPSALSIFMAHEKNDITYNIPFYIKLPKSIDIKKFESALNSAFLSHKIFCAKITNEPKMLYEKQDLKLEFQKTNDFKSFLKDFIKPFDLENSRLYRFCLCECKNEYYFIADVHHSIFDGSSLKIFLNEIADFYNGKKTQIQPEALAFSKNYLELLATRQKDSFKDEILNINSAPISDIFDENKNDEFLIQKSLKSTKKIKEFLGKNKLSAESFFASVFGLALMKFNNENECEFLLSNKDRHHKEIEQSVGMFVETFALHFSMPKADILKSLCAKKDEYSINSSFLSSMRAF